MTLPIISNTATIQAVDYTQSQEILADIIGLGENGYGMPGTLSGPVNTRTKVRSQDWNYLLRDLNSVSIHITNTATGISTVSNTTIVNSTLSNSVWDGVSELVPSRYICHPDQYFTDPVTSETWNTTNGTSTRTLVWDMDANSEITHKVNAAWTTALTARYFFNQGGYFIYKPFHLNNGTTSTVDTAWVSFIDYVGAIGGFEYKRDQFVSTTTNIVTKSWSSGTLGISVLAERSADRDSVLFTVKYKRPQLELVPSRAYWNILS